MNFILREMLPHDRQAVSRVLSRGYEFLAEHQGFTNEQLQRLLTERASEEAIRIHFVNYQCFVAEYDSTVVGVVTAKDNTVMDLFVDPAYHRIGTALFKMVEKLIQQSGHKELVVKTTGYSIPFYEAMGMSIVGQETACVGPLKGWVCTHLKKTFPDNKEA